MRKINYSQQPEFDLCENRQVTRHKLMLANATPDGGIYAVSPAFACREYYGDAVFTSITGLRINEYGFDTKETDWEGEYVITTYIQSSSKIRGKLKRYNAKMEGTIPPIEFEELDMEGDLDCHGKYSCGFLIEVPEWYHETIVRASYFTALLRTLYYADPMNIKNEDGYAEACIQKFHNFKFPETIAPSFKKSIWEAVIFPALNLTYENCLCMPKNEYEQALKKIDMGTYYYVHSGSGIYSVWNILRQFKNKTSEYYLNKTGTLPTINKLLISNFIENTNNLRNLT